KHNSLCMDSKITIRNIVPPGLKGDVIDVNDLVTEFVVACEPLEKEDVVSMFADGRTSARFCECHILASKLVRFSTLDVPLDPEEQPEYRANREIVTNAHAFEVMKQDAIRRRSFKMFRLEDRIKYLSKRFSVTAIDKNASYWADLKSAMKLRNSLTHPK